MESCRRARPYLSLSRPAPRAFLRVLPSAQPYVSLSQGQESFERYRPRSAVTQMSSGVYAAGLLVVKDEYGFILGPSTATLVNATTRPCDPLIIQLSAQNVYRKRLKATKQAFQNYYCTFTARLHIRYPPTSRGFPFRCQF